MSTPSRRAALCGALYVFAFLLLATVLRGHFGFPLDDSWIHQTIARNLAQTHVLGFRPGLLSSGSTSLLWTLILALGEALFPSLSPVIDNLVLSVLAMFGIGYTLKRLTEDDRLPAKASWCFVLAPIASGNFLWFGLISMEHLLFFLLSLALIRAWFQSLENNSRVRLLHLFLLSALLAMTRPEGVFLAPLLVLLGRKYATPRSMLAVLCGTASGWACSAAANLLTAGRLTPLTMQGRAGPGAGGFSFRAATSFLAKAFMRLLETWGYYGTHRLMHGRWLLLGVTFAAAICFLMFLALSYLLSIHASRTVLLCCWAATLLLLYSVVLPYIGHGGRYISVPLALFLPLVFLGLHQAAKAVIGDSRAWAVVTVAFLATALVSISLWYRVAAADIDQINSEHAAVAAWLKTNLPASPWGVPQVAAYDIGRIGYEFHGNIIDMGGLVDPQFMPAVHADQVATYLQAHGVQYLVLPADVEELDESANSFGLNPAHGIRLTLLDTVCGNPEAVKFAFDLTSTAARCQKIYKIQYRDSADK